MTATQAPTPGPLSGDLAERLRFAETWDLDADQQARDRCGVLMLEAAEALESLAPTAPVEASGSELTAAQRRSMSIQAAPSADNVEAAGCAEPQVGRAVYERIEKLLTTNPKGWERDYLCHLVESVEELGGYDGPLLGWRGDRQAVADFLKLRDENVGPGEADDAERLESAEAILALSTTPARAEAQDEGAAGEPVAWRDVVGFEGLYEVSSDGNVRSVKTGRIQAKNLMGHGYVKAELWRDGVRKQTSVHRVVAEAFLPRIDGLDEVNHIDGDKQNNSVANLEWSDRKSNTDHSRYILGNDVKAVLAIDPEDGSEEYFPSIEEAGRSGYKASGVYAALNGIKKTHGGKRWVLTEWRNPAHPSPPPAADEDRVRIAVEALEPFNEAYQAYLAVYANFMPQAATEAEQRFAEGERKDTAEEAAFDVLSKVSFEQLCAVNEALAALKSTAAKEGEKS